MASYSISNATTLTATISLHSLTATTTTLNGWQGAAIDFGASRAGLWLAKIQAKPTSAPTAGNALQLYMSWSNANTTTPGNFPGGASGSDGQYLGPTGGDPQQGANLMMGIGALGAAASAVIQSKIVGPFVPPARYGCPVVINNMGVAPSTLSSDHVITFTSLDESVA